LIDADTLLLIRNSKKGKDGGRESGAGICQGCRITLPNTDLQRARGGGVVRCSSCGRIIFLA